MKDAVREGRVLVVDLDGTLIRSDMLLETFWGAFGCNWQVPLIAGAALLRGGRAALKRRLAQLAPPDPATLPYAPEVLGYIDRWRAAGGRVALVSAADQGLVQAVADHLGRFDEVHGSDGRSNLKGAAKGQLLAARFGRGGYVYIGDSTADLAVWRDAARAVTAGVPAGLRTQVDGLGVPSEHLPGAGGGMATLMTAMRPHQWLKNLLVFMPVLAGHHFGMAILGQSLLAFLAFCLVASAVYLINDLLDLAADRAHPRKRARPLASGALPLGHGSVAAPLLLVAGLAVAAVLEPRFLAVLAGYFLLTLLYSLWLKRVVVADIVTLSVLYTARIVAGGVATGIIMSVWLLAFSIFFFLAMAAVKRQAELVDSAERGVLQTAGRGYRADDLPLVAQMATASGYLSVLVLALYLNTPSVQQLYPYPPLLWGICLVLLYWISRVVMITHRGGMDDDPILFAVRDPISRVCILLVLALAVAATAVPA